MFSPPRTCPLVPCLLWQQCSSCAHWARGAVLHHRGILFHFTFFFFLNTAHRSVTQTPDISLRKPLQYTEYGVIFSLPLFWFYVKMSWLKNLILKLTMTKIRNVITLYLPGKKLRSQRFPFIDRILLFLFFSHFCKESNSCRAVEFCDHP